MHKIEKGTKLYAFGTSGEAIVVSVELVVPSTVKEIINYEAIVSLNIKHRIANSYKTFFTEIVGTASVNMTISPRNAAQVNIQLLKIMSAELDLTEEDDIYLDANEFISQCLTGQSFLFGAKAAYYRYCRAQLDAQITENKQKTEEFKLAQEDRKKKNLDSFKNKGDISHLLDYAKRYRLASSDLLKDDSFIKEGTEVGDHVFAYIPLYGVHPFVITAKSTDGIGYTVSGVNKYSGTKVVLDCLLVNGYLLPTRNSAEKDESCNYWYTDPDLCGVLQSIVIRRSVSLAIQDAVYRDIAFAKQEIAKQALRFEVETAGRKNLVNVLSLNLANLEVVSKNSSNT